MQISLALLWSFKSTKVRPSTTQVSPTVKLSIEEVAEAEHGVKRRVFFYFVGQASWIIIKNIDSHQYSSPKIKKFRMSDWKWPAFAGRKILQISIELRYNHKITPVQWVYHAYFMIIPWLVLVSRLMIIKINNHNNLKDTKPERLTPSLISLRNDFISQDQVEENIWDLNCATQTRGIIANKQRVAPCLHPSQQIPPWLGPQKSLDPVLNQDLLRGIWLISIWLVEGISYQNLSFLLSATECAIPGSALP